MSFANNRDRTIIVSNSQILLEKLATFWTPAWMMFEDRGIEAETETLSFFLATGDLTRRFGLVLTAKTRSPFFGRHFFVQVTVIRHKFDKKKGDRRPYKIRR